MNDQDVLRFRKDEVRLIAQHQIVKHYPGSTRVRCLCGETMGGGWGWAEHVVTQLYAPVPTTA